MEKLALRIFGALFLLNALVTVMMALPREYAVWLASDPSDPVTRAFRAVDAATGYLFVAFALARGRLPAHRALSWTFLAVGALVGILAYPFHPVLVESNWLLQAAPLEIGLAIAAWGCAAGKPWERWVALALLPRMLYWGAGGLFLIARDGFGAQVHLYANRIGLLGLLLAALAASWRLLRTPAAPTRAVAVPILLLGPGLAFIDLALVLNETPGNPYWFGSLVLVNLVTLALVRPLVTLAGVEPESLTRVTGQSALAAGVGALSTLIVRFNLPAARPTGIDLAVGEAVTFGFGLMIGLFTLAVLQWIPAPTKDAAALPAPGGPGDPPGAGTVHAPHWQLLLLALREAGEGADARATQRGIAATTGLRPARVSTLARELNEGAAARLDAHAPGWRDTYRGVGAPRLIEQHRGAVVGMPGVWTYYELTPQGCLVADALAQGASSKGHPFPEEQRGTPRA